MMRLCSHIVYLPTMEIRNGFLLVTYYIFLSVAQSPTEYDGYIIRIFLLVMIVPNLVIR